MHFIPLQLLPDIDRMYFDLFIAFKSVSLSVDQLQSDQVIPANNRQLCSVS